MSDNVQFTLRREHDLDNMTHDQIIPAHNQEFKRLNKRMDEEEDFTKKMIDLTSKQQSAIERLQDDVRSSKKQTEAIYRLGASVEHMVIGISDLSVQVKDMVGVTSNHEYRLTDIEKNTMSEDLKASKHEAALLINEVKDDVEANLRAISELRNAPAKKIASYVDHGFKAVLVVVLLTALYLLSNGVIGG